MPLHSKAIDIQPWGQSSPDRQRHGTSHWPYLSFYQNPAFKTILAIFMPIPHPFNKGPFLRFPNPIKTHVHFRFLGTMINKEVKNHFYYHISKHSGKYIYFWTYGKLFFYLFFHMVIYKKSQHTFR